MIDLDPPFRPATVEDAPVLAELVNHAGEGLPEYLWSQIAGPGEDPWQIGRERQAKKAADGQIIVVDQGDGPIAGLTGYAIPAEPEPIPDDMPAMFVPMQALENLAPATWYVNVLAVLPRHRGQGWGTKLLDLAEMIAAEQGLTGLSLIVADSNLLAQRLYERQGYAELARREMVKDGWQSRGRDWVLMIKGAGTIGGADEA